MGWDLLAFIVYVPLSNFVSLWGYLSQGQLDKRLIISCLHTNYLPHGLVEFGYSKIWVEKSPSILERKTKPQLDSNIPGGKFD